MRVAAPLVVALVLFASASIYGVTAEMTEEETANKAEGLLNAAEAGDLQVCIIIIVLSLSSYSTDLRERHNT